SNRVRVFPDGTRKAEICVQMQLLTRVPATALRQELGAAFINELVEMAGMSHDIGLYVQQYALSHYDRFCVLQVYPSDTARAQGQPDRYRVWLRNLPN